MSERLYRHGTAEGITTAVPSIGAAGESAFLSLAVAGPGIVGSASYAAFHLLVAPWTSLTVVVLLLSLTSLWLAKRFLSARGSRHVASLLLSYSAQGGLCLLEVVRYQPQAFLRLLALAALLSYFSTFVAASLSSRRSPARNRGHGA